MEFTVQSNGSASSIHSELRVLMAVTIADELTIMASAPARAITVRAVRCGYFAMLSAARNPRRSEKRRRSGEAAREAQSVACGITRAAPRKAKNDATR